jgi:hypothetical protein
MEVVNKVGRLLFEQFGPTMTPHDLVAVMTAWQRCILAKEREVNGSRIHPDQLQSQRGEPGLFDY